MTDSKENVIREKRTIEATKKNFMGPAGKFGVILRAFGSPIIRQGSGLFDEGFLDSGDADQVHTEYSTTISGQQGPVVFRDEIKEFSDDYVFSEGHVFDGLSRGMHIEIIQKESTNELTVTYKGYVVYREVAGELDSYAPFPDWEDMIERLYRTAKERVKKLKKMQEEQISFRVDESKKSFWQRLRMRWGV
jgi:hypothetical protein